MSRWFMFFWLPWFLLGATAWTRLAWRYTLRTVPVEPRLGHEGDAACPAAPTL